MMNVFDDDVLTDQFYNAISLWNKTPLEMFEYAEKHFSKHYGTWKIIENYDDLEKFTYRKFTALYIATGGWSENEMVIDALHLNIFYSLFFVAQIQGGLYILDYDKIIQYGNNKSIR